MEDNLNCKEEFLIDFTLDNLSFNNLIINNHNIQEVDSYFIISNRNWDFNYNCIINCYRF